MNDRIYLIHDLATLVEALDEIEGGLRRAADFLRFREPEDGEEAFELAYGAGRIDAARNTTSDARAWLKVAIRDERLS